MTDYTKLDEIRARVLDSEFPQIHPGWRHYLEAACTVRISDEKEGIPADGLLALLEGRAVIVPGKPTVEMANAGRFVGRCERCQGHNAHHVSDSTWEAMIAASPWAPKKEGE